MTHDVTSIWSSPLLQTALEHLEQERRAYLLAAAQALTSNAVVRAGWDGERMTAQTIPLSEFYRQA